MQAGSTDVLVDALPGVPDGISRSLDGNFWLALPVPRSPLLGALRFKLLRSVLPWLPARLRPPIQGWGMVLKVCMESGYTLIRLTAGHALRSKVLRSMLPCLPALARCSRYRT